MAELRKKEGFLGSQQYSANMNPCGKLSLEVVFVLELFPYPFGLASGNRKESSGRKQSEKSQLKPSLPPPK